MTDSSITMTRCARVLADMQVEPDDSRFRTLTKELAELRASKRVYPELEREIEAAIYDAWDRQLERLLKRHGATREEYAAFLLAGERHQAEAG